VDPGERICPREDELEEREYGVQRVLRYVGPYLEARVEVVVDERPVYNYMPVSIVKWWTVRK
jgi:hypothetical protein